MRHHYVGDVGDFGKYGLLRAITGEFPAEQPRLSLGVIWYLNHRKAIEYLACSDHYLACDPFLFGKLGEIVSDESTREQPLDRIEESTILGDHTVFFRVPIPRGHQQRQSWWREAHKQVAGCEVVFLDPDNSLKTSTESGTSHEHAYLHEVEPLVARGQTTIVYQSYGRRGHIQQMAEWSSALVERLQLDRDPVILSFNPAVNPPKIRAFIILLATDREALVEHRVERLLQGPWGKYFNCFRR